MHFIPMDKEAFMTIRHLRIFVAVFDRMNVTRAAEAMHLTQPVVTRTIKELEQHYGIVLFDRINHRLRATDAGRSFYAYAMQVLSAFDAMETGVLAQSDHFTVSIGSTYYLGSYVLPGSSRNSAPAFRMPPSAHAS